jgi:hypothetical protein
MCQFTELLPPTKTDPKGQTTMAWEPSTDNEFSPVAGVLTLTGKRCHCRYVVQEFAADIGRGFMLLKAGKGSDEAEEHYAVLVPRHGRPMCECKGFVRHGHCKHAFALLVLTRAGKL